MSTVTCRNCDQQGHFSKECPLPRDCKLSLIHAIGFIANCATGSKVQCSNCQEYGHTKVRCKAPPVEEADAFGDGDGGWGGDDGAVVAQTAGGDDDGW
ncbi:uncharacterized protein B0J16DRAFT_80835 [Fusarium flagelliforme]|uniref:uncharacterized protein n=1 Tax=Fusarium flagelliforme TaxID=2675880 RepID=UPI001E8D288C|nr:uncharacterized protein B0J16DRAFT_80835 [Fusarium flagelliforme]KAH7193498.1 hypothetical protein B0J16DRAFT_80835 [Fusarium flagelliforme]